MQDTYLDKIYDAPDQEAKQNIYAEWSKSYDAELTSSGYATPARCAKALHRVATDFGMPVLDLGCGTGLSGEALKAEGFTTIDGLDPSAEMLEEAKAKGVYRNVEVMDTNAPLPADYAAIAAIGVVGSGAAPLSLLDEIIEALIPGAKTVFSFNDHTLEDPAYAAHVQRYIDDGVVRELFREHGPHLPAENIGATVYVLEKT